MYTFKKAERLHGTKLIDTLFEEGYSFYIAPFRVVWLDQDHDSGFPAQVLISVSKKTIRLAVDRNRIKRIIKEAYRIHKAKFYDFLNSHNKQCIFAIIFSGTAPVPYDFTEKKMVALLDRLIEEYKKHIFHNEKPE